MNDEVPSALHRVAQEIYYVALDCGWNTCERRNGGVMLTREGAPTIVLEPNGQFPLARAGAILSKVIERGDPRMVAAWKAEHNPVDVLGQRPKRSARAHANGSGNAVDEHLTQRLEVPEAVRTAVVTPTAAEPEPAAPAEPAEPTESASADEDPPLRTDLGEARGMRKEVLIEYFRRRPGRAITSTEIAVYFHVQVRTVVANVRSLLNQIPSFRAALTVYEGEHVFQYDPDAEPPVLAQSGPAVNDELLSELQAHKLLLERRLAGLQTDKLRLQEALERSLGHRNELGEQHAQLTRAHDALRSNVVALRDLLKGIEL